MDMPVYPGDPLTPGVGATPDAKRLAIKDAQTLTKIPVLPISYADAQPLLASLTGAVVPADWRGGLPITYRFGPGAGRAHLKLAFNWDQKPLYDVIARLRGSTFPDQWVIRGNHHDAWVNGAEDPVSGMAASSKRRARSASCASRDGRRSGRSSTARGTARSRRCSARPSGPRRTRPNCSSTPSPTSTPTATAAAFFRWKARTRSSSSSTTSRGTSGSGNASHGLEAAAGAGDRRGQAGGEGEGRAARRLAHRRARIGLRLHAVPAALGVPSLNIGFGGEDDSGIYHSIYDDFYFYTHFLDTDFAYGRALAQTGGTAVMRLADADILPFHYANLADTVRTYDEELQQLVKKKRDDVAERNREIADGVFAAINDPRRPRVAPKAEAMPPALDFTPISRAIEALARRAVVRRGPRRGGEEDHRLPRRSPRST